MYQINFNYLSVYSGFTYSKIWKNKLAFQLSLKAGAYKIQLGSGHFTSSIQLENNQSLQTIESNFIFNGFDRVFMMIFPEAKITYNIKKLPIGFSLGVATFYSPNPTVGGHIILNGDADDYMVYLYDHLQSFGVSIGVSYSLKQSKLSSIPLP